MQRLELSYRPGTQDELAIREVLFGNEYRLPERFEPDDRIIDIGAHIGAFAIACLERGAKQLWCYEPVKDNFQLLNENLTKGWRRWSSANGNNSIDLPPAIQIHNRAVWRNDEGMGLHFMALAGPTNTAMAVVMQDDQPQGKVDPKGQVQADGPQLEQVLCVPFDQVIFQVTEGWKYPVRFVKIDAEGSEWMMLEGAQTLGHIDEIAIEVHLAAHQLCGQHAGRLEALRAGLEESGLATEEIRHPYCPETLTLIRGNRHANGTL